MEENYLSILIQSLEKKTMVLNEISQENGHQADILKADELDIDAFQESIDKKTQLIEQISFLDDGFEKMYGHVKGTLNEKKQEYAKEIARLKELIGKITEQTVIIQREEWDNRKLAEQQFGNSKKKVRQMKVSKQAATTYYQNMAKLNFVDPQFMDKKK